MEPFMPSHDYMIHASDPQTYAKVTRHPTCEDAMDEEYNYLIKNHI